MKNFLLLLFLSFLFCSTNGQSLVLTKLSGDTIHNQDVIVIYKDTLTSTIYADAWVKNISALSKDIRVKYHVISEVSGSENSYCWGLTCISPPAPSPSTDTVIIDPDESKLFQGEYFHHGNFGTTIIRYTFFDLANPNDSISFTAEFHITPTSIKELTNKIQFSNAYPNPANDICNFNYEIPTGIENTQLVIYNLIGSSMLQENILHQKGTIKVNTSTYPEGIYFYSLIVENKTLFTKKFIVRH